MLGAALWLIVCLRYEFITSSWFSHRRFITKLCQLKDRLITICYSERGKRISTVLFSRVRKYFPIFNFYPKVKICVHKDEVTTLMIKLCISTGLQLVWIDGCRILRLWFWIHYNIWSLLSDAVGYRADPRWQVEQTAYCRLRRHYLFHSILHCKWLCNRLLILRLHSQVTT